MTSPGLVFRRAGCRLHYVDERPDRNSTNRPRNSPAAAAPASRSSPNYESRFQNDGVRQIVDVGGSGHYRVVDFGELLLGTTAPDTNGVTQALVAVCHLRVDPKKTPEVDFTLGLNLQGFERDPADGALRHITHRYASIQ